MPDEFNYNIQTMKLPIVQAFTDAPPNPQFGKSIICKNINVSNEQAKPDFYLYKAYWKHKVLSIRTSGWYSICGPDFPLVQINTNISVGLMGTELNPYIFERKIVSFFSLVMNIII